MKPHHFEEILSYEPSSLQWHYRIYVPKDIVETIQKNAGKGKERRVVCHINETLKFQAALTSDGKGSFYIAINKEHRIKLGDAVNEKLQITLENDTSKYGIALPIEMETLLEQDEIGRTYFEQLTPGRQRSLLHIIAKPKSEAIRIKKAIVVLDYLVSTKGKLDFKELNEAFKQANKTD